MADKILERDVEAYLVKRVKEIGGEIRKVGWIGRRGAPDRFVMTPGSRPNFWVELKAPGKKPEPHQQREIERLQKYDEIVHVIDSFALVDAALLPWGRNRKFLAAYDAAGMNPPRGQQAATEAYRHLMAKKEQALAGWIAYVALQNPRSSALSPRYLHAMFGDWATRAFRLERRGESWVLIG